MTLEDQLATLKSHLAVAESEMASLKAGRKSAAPRLRKSLMALKTGSHGMRAGTTNYVRGLPTKSRSKKDEPVEPVESEQVEQVEPPKPKKRAPRKKVEVSD